MSVPQPVQQLTILSPEICSNDGPHQLMAAVLDNRSCTPTLETAQTYCTALSDLRRLAQNSPGTIHFNQGTYRRFEESAFKLCSESSTSASVAAASAKIAILEIQAFNLIGFLRVFAKNEPLSASEMKEVAQMIPNFRDNWRNALLVSIDGLEELQLELLATTDTVLSTIEGMIGEKIHEPEQLVQLFEFAKEILKLSRLLGSHTESSMKYPRDAAEQEQELLHYEVRAMEYFPPKYQNKIEIENAVAIFFQDDNPSTRLFADHLQSKLDKDIPFNNSDWEELRDILPRCSEPKSFLGVDLSATQRVRRLSCDTLAKKINQKLLK